MDVIDRLVLAVTKSGLKRVYIAALAGISPTKLSKILNRKQPPILSEFIAICEAIKLEPGRLFTKGDLVIELKALREAYADLQRVHHLLGSWLPEPVEEPASTPLLLPKPAQLRVAAPVLAAANSNVELLPEVEEWLIPRRAKNRGAQLIARATGDSMAGGDDPIADGELVFVKRTRSARTAKGHVVLCRLGEGMFLKKFEITGKTIRLLSANSNYATMELDARTADFQLYGIAVDHAAER